MFVLELRKKEKRVPSGLQRYIRHPEVAFILTLRLQRQTFNRRKVCLGLVAQ